jgi:hypothetical protein
MAILTKGNAEATKTIRNLDHPEWGTKRFNYNEQPLNDGEFVSSFGVGSNSSILFEKD